MSREEQERARRKVMTIAVCFSGLEVQTKWWKQSAIECRCFAKQENTALIKRAVLMALRVSVLGGADLLEKASGTL
ncbi:hypothetical protein BV899_05155 [Alcaligenes phenolicus]|nr:hypothetical protein BV899_05155 [Alcaligenes phenolicus]